jgi:molybdopterin synthase sulfur carrier subunit
VADQLEDRIAVTVRYFAAARTASGVTEEELVIMGPATVADALAAAVALHGPRLGDVLPKCSYLLGETAVHGIQTGVTDGDILDVLPPFAGG